MATRSTDWRTIVLRADPDHTRDSRNPVEYEFTSRTGGKDQVHEGSRRIFRGVTARRGPYAPDED